jgi:hypothetical protein
MHFSRIAALVAASLVLAPAAASTTTSSGLHGKVTRGPIMPVCREDKPCSGPAAVTLVFTRAGAPAVRTRSGADGLYRVTLRPGYYTVTTTLNGPSKQPRPTRVHVRRGHVDRLDFSIDTGIR